MRKDTFFDLIGCDANKRLIATDTNPENGEIHGALFDVRTDFVRDMIHIELETWHHTVGGENKRRPFLSLDLNWDDGRMDDCQLQSLSYAGVSLNTKKMDLEELAPHLAAIAARLKDRRLPDFSALTDYMQEAVS